MQAPRTCVSIVFNTLCSIRCRGGTHGLCFNGEIFALAVLNLIERLLHVI